MRRSAMALCGAAMTMGVVGCVPAFDANKHAMTVGVPPEGGTVNLRQLESRRFDTLDEAALLSAAIQTLQDLGFTMAATSAEVGVVTASKQRDAVESGQVAGQVAIGILLALMGTYHDPVYDQAQTINVTLVTTPVENSKQIEVRCVFDRVVTNNKGVKWRAELIRDEAIYQEFFNKLSQSAFLEAHGV